MRKPRPSAGEFFYTILTNQAIDLILDGCKIIILLMKDETKEKENVIQQLIATLKPGSEISVEAAINVIRRSKENE